MGNQLQPLPDTFPKGIALIGGIGAGKSTTANALMAISGDPIFTPFGLVPIRLSFADALRSEVAKVLSAAECDSKDILTVKDRLMVYDRYLKALKDPELKKPYRPLMQWWGQWRRNTCGDSYWRDKVITRINDIRWMQKSPILPLIDDCRYDNEYHLLKTNGFIFIKLAPNPDPSYVETNANQTHDSEIDWKLWEVDLELDWEPLTSRVAKIADYLDSYL